MHQAFGALCLDALTLSFLPTDGFSGLNHSKLVTSSGLRRFRHGEVCVVFARSDHVQPGGGCQPQRALRGDQRRELGGAVHH